MAVKRLWRRFNQHDALGQMLLTNQCLDKLNATCNDFVHRGLLPPSHLDSILRGAHLLPAFGEATHLPADFHFSYSLDVFEAYYINKYADNQMYEICS